MDLRVSDMDHRSGDSGAWPVYSSQDRQENQQVIHHFYIRHLAEIFSEKEKNKMNNLYLIYVIDNMIEDVEDSKLDLMLMCL